MCLRQQSVWSTSSATSCYQPPGRHPRGRASREGHAGRWRRRQPPRTTWLWSVATLVSSPGFAPGGQRGSDLPLVASGLVCKSSSCPDVQNYSDRILYGFHLKKLNKRTYFRIFNINYSPCLHQSIHFVAHFVFLLLCISCGCTASATSILFEEKWFLKNNFGVGVQIFLCHFYLCPSETNILKHLKLPSASFWKS